MRADVYLWIFDSDPKQSKSVRAKRLDKFGEAKRGGRGVRLVILKVPRYYFRVNNIHIRELLITTYLLIISILLSYFVDQG